MLRPLAGDSLGPRPAMLWFHGGSGTTGSWSHSPSVVSAPRANGVAVVAVEFRSRSRFDVGPIEQYADALAALAHVRTHAVRLDLDGNRIGVAGFSSGAGLALTLGTRGVDAVRPSPHPSQRTYPADFAPIDLVAAGQPPTLLPHGTNDEYCAYQDVEAFVARSRAAGNAVTLSSVAGATHFFGFYHRPGQAQMRSAIADALVTWGWTR